MHKFCCKICCCLLQLIAVCDFCCTLRFLFRFLIYPNKHQSLYISVLFLLIRLQVHINGGEYTGHNLGRNNVKYFLYTVLHICLVCMYSTVKMFETPTKFFFILCIFDIYGPHAAAARQMLAPGSVVFSLPTAITHHWLHCSAGHHSPLWG